MSSVLLAIVVILAVLIIISVLMQPSKADGGLGGLASGMTSDVLGASSNEFLAKATWWMFGIFVMACLFFGKMKASENAEKLEEKNAKSVLEQPVSVPKVEEAPAVEETKIEEKAAEEKPEAPAEAK